MKAVSKIVFLSAFKEANGFSSDLASGKKIASQSMPLENGKGPENKGLQAPHGDTPHPVSGEKIKKATKKKKIPKGKVKKPKVTPTPGPTGYKVDCTNMQATLLTMAYPSEWNSWRNRKSACMKFPDKYTWDPAWKVFRDFLLDMGSMPQDGKKYTLDRTDNSDGRYGPGRCTWATKTEQNNNKGDNIMIIHPLTGEVFTSHKLAKMHGVQIATIHKWNAQNYSPLEMIVGKKSAHLLAVSVALDERNIPAPNSGKVIKRPQIKKIPAQSQFDDDKWDPTPEELDHYEQTGVMRSSRHDQAVEEWKAVVAWVYKWNAGLPCSPQPPMGQFCKIRVSAPPTEAAPSKPSKYVHDEADFDPTDCVDPADDGDFDDCDPGDNEDFGDEDA